MSRGAYSIGPKIGIDGESEFRKAIAGISNQMSNLGSEMRLVTSQFDKNEVSMESLSAKSGVLNKRIEQQQQYVKTLGEVLGSVTEKYGEGSEAAMKYQAKLNDATAKLNDMNRDLQDNEKQMKSLKDESSLTSKELDILSGSARENGESFKTMSEKMKDAGKALSDLGGKLKIVSGLAAGALVAGVKYASDFEQAVGKVEDTFGAFSREIEDWSKTSLKNFGIARGTALEMAALYGNMGKGVGLADKAAAEMSTTLTGLAGDLAAFHNVSIDQASKALEGIFTGQGQSLKGLGIIMNDATLKSFAMANGFRKNMKNMTELEKVQLRYAFILDQTEVAQGNVVKTSGDTATSFQIMQESLKELAEVLGQQLLPIITPFIQGFTRVIQGLAGLNPGMQGFILTLLAITAASAPTLIFLGNLLTSFGKIKDFLPILKSGFASLNKTILANPFVLIVAAIMAVIVILVKLYEENEAFKKGVDAVAKAISDTVKKAADAVWFKNLPATLTQIGKDMMQGLLDGIKSKISDIKKNIKDTFEGIVKDVKGTLGIRSPSRVFAGIGGNMAAGLEKGWRNAIGSVQGKIDSTVPTTVGGAGAGGGAATYNDNRIITISPQDLTMWNKIVELVQGTENSRRIQRMT